MELYFLRHGIAIQHGTVPYPNDDRPLTEDGVQKMKRAAEGIAKLVKSFDIILTSPLVRAYDTARITAQALHYKGKIERCKQLLPGADFKEVVSLLETHRGSGSLLLVGHEPNMSKTVSAFLGSQHTLIEFKKGGLCKIRLTGAPALRAGVLLYHLTPKQLRVIAR